MVILHAHESGVVVCFGVAIASVKYLLLLCILVQIGCKVLFGIVQFSLYLLVNFFVLQCFVYFCNGLFYLFTINRCVVKIRRFRTFEFIGSNALCILP